MLKINLFDKVILDLGENGKKGVDWHPKIGNGVLLGAGATVLGPVRVGDGCQIEAGVETFVTYERSRLTKPFCQSI
jgi:serine acetyltransferase